jgi:hypothetical protein
MAEPAKRIAVVQGAPSADIQVLFRSLTDRWRSSARLAGVIAEDHGLPDRACAAGYLVSLADGVQDLGRSATGCHLAPAGALAAAAAVQSDVAAGCDLVVLSKFGQLEKKGGGLRDAFTTAIEAGIPVLTSVSPAYMAAWESYAASLSVTIAPDPEQIDAWWQSVRPAQEHDPKPQRPTTGE